MYHCHVQFYFIGMQPGELHTIQEMPPRKGFTHGFSAGEAPDAATAAGADVVIARIPAGKLPALAAMMKPGAQLIWLADGEETNALAEAPEQLCDIWPASMAEWEFRFRFEQWQERNKLSKNLWQANYLLEAGLNSTPELVWFKNKDGVYRKVNDSFCAAAGKPREQVEGKTSDSVWGEKRENIIRIPSEKGSMEPGTIEVWEEVVRADGSRAQLKTYQLPLYDLDGSEMGTVGVALDVTREKTIEKEIDEKNRTLEMLFSTMDCGIMWHSLDGKRILNINRAALRLLGYDSKQEMLDDGFTLVAQSVLDEDKPILRDTIRSLTKVGDSASAEYRVRHKDGTLLHILGNVKLTEENGERLYQRFLVDITDQKQQEAEKWAKKDRELRHQEQMFDIFSAFLADQVDDIYMMMDGTGTKIEFITPNVERVLGVPHDVIMADPNRIGHAKYFSGWEVGSQRLSEMEPGMALEPMETERIHMKTGEPRRFQESVYCVELQGAKKIMICISDRTKEWKSQSALAEALNMAKVASKAKSTFLSSVSHDIRTPMNAIMGLVTLLREEAGNPRQVLEYTQKISAASQHLLGLINDVLDMNKIESGSAVLNISDMTLAGLIDELNTIIRPQTNAKNQVFEIQTAAIVNEHLLGDKMRISQIMINILSNAVKYTQDGGKIVMRVEELPQAEKNYSRIRFTVRDNGQGMSREYQQVIFDPFTREQETVWNQMQGTGLGMSITKRLVDLMGGTIRVESELGKGSTFIVELELRIQEEENDPAFWETHQIARMLVVDDDADICRSIVKKMEGTGVVTHYATDGAEAINAVHAAREKGTPYDLVILDWKMPGQDGLETARRLREDAPGHPPILLFTAYDWAEIKEDALHAGIEHFLPKPFFLSSFKETLRRMGSEKGISNLRDGKAVVTGKKILVVDDIEVNRMILVKILKTLGAECDEAVDGQEAFERFTASRPGEYDIILMDIQMPHLNGYDATRAIRASGHPSAQSVAIIAMSANAFIDDIRKSLESGMDAHIPKPVVVNQMKQTIQEVLDKKSCESAVEQAGPAS